MTTAATIKSLGRALRRLHQVRFRSVSATLTRGEAIMAGNVKVENAAGRMLVSIGKDLAFVITADPAGTYNVRCYSNGRRIPQKIGSSIPACRQAGAMPLVRIGPGGDFVRDWPREVRDDPSVA